MECCNNSQVDGASVFSKNLEMFPFAFLQLLLGDFITPYYYFVRIKPFKKNPPIFYNIKFLRELLEFKLFIYCQHVSAFKFL